MWGKSWIFPEKSWTLLRFVARRIFLWLNDLAVQEDDATILMRPLDGATLSNCIIRPASLIEKSTISSKRQVNRSPPMVSTLLDITLFVLRVCNQIVLTYNAREQLEMIALFTVTLPLLQVSYTRCRAPQSLAMLRNMVSYILSGGR